MEIKKPELKLIINILFKEEKRDQMGRPYEADKSFPLKDLRKAQNIIEKIYKDSYYKDKEGKKTKDQEKSAIPAIWFSDTKISFDREEQAMIKRLFKEQPAWRTDQAKFVFELEEKLNEKKKS